MRVAVFVKATKSSEKGEMPDMELMEEMGKFNVKLAEADVLRAGEGLKPSSEGVRVRFDGESRTLTQGPFAETNEVVAGFWLWEVESMQAAIDWVKQCPNPMPESSEIEIRPLYEFSDFEQADGATEFAQEEEQLRTALATRQSETMPYLFFAGRCEEALEFYQGALGAKVVMALRFNQSPDPLPEGMLQQGFEEKIMHAEMKVGTSRFFMSDGCCDTTQFDGMRLAITLDQKEDVTKVFSALSEEGNVDMPLAETFFSPYYGQVTDKFGLGWMVMVKEVKSY